MKKLLIITALSLSVFGACKKDALTEKQTITYDCSTCCGGMDITYKDAAGAVQSVATMDKTWTVSLQVEATDSKPKYLFCTAKPKKSGSLVRVKCSDGSFAEAVNFAQVGQ